MQNRPSEESPCDLVRLKRHGWPRRKPMGLPSLLTEVSGGGFAGSPDVPANVTAARVCPQYAGMHRVECETSGLDRRISSAAHAQKDALAAEALTFLPAIYASRVAGSIPIRSRQNCANSSASAARKTWGSFAKRLSLIHISEPT